MNAYEHGKVPLTGTLERHEGYTKLVTSVTLSFFKSALVSVSPQMTEKAKARDLMPDLDEIWDLRKQVQRLFEKSKKENATDFSRYMERGVFEKDFYTLPPIALFTPDPVEARVRSDNKPVPDSFGIYPDTIVYIEPGITRIVAIDGETQSEALYQFFERARHDPHKREKLLKMPITIEFHFGADIAWARQTFHDRNRFGVKANSSLAVTMDARDPLVEVSSFLEEVIPALKGRINGVKRQLGSKDSEFFTSFSFYQYLACLFEGIKGLQKKGASGMSDEELASLKKVARDWTHALLDTLGPKIGDRNNYLVSAPSVLAALGAFGHRVYFEKLFSKADALNHIQSIDWSKGKHWSGIAGKWNPTKSSMTVGGPKEVATLILSAISDKNSDQYSAVKMQQGQLPSTESTSQLANPSTLP